MQDNVVDASDSREDWDAGVASGALKRVVRDPGGLHVQGERLTAAEARRANDGNPRVITPEQAKEMSTTKRLPSAGKLTFVGGWPEFDKDGKVKRS